MNYELLMGVLQERKEKILKHGLICVSNILGDAASQMSHSFDESHFTSPKLVRSKGLPPFKRKMSRLNKLSKGRKRMLKR